MTKQKWSLFNQNARKNGIYLGAIWHELGRARCPAPYVDPHCQELELLLGRTGLTIGRVMFDSGVHQFVGSEQYVRSIPSTSEESYYADPKKSIFNARQVTVFKKLAKQLNKANQGD